MSSWLAIIRSVNRRSPNTNYFTHSLLPVAGLQLLEYFSHPHNLLWTTQKHVCTIRFYLHILAEAFHALVTQGRSFFHNWTIARTSLFRRMVLARLHILNSADFQFENVIVTFKCWKLRERERERERENEEWESSHCYEFETTRLHVDVTQGQFLSRV